MTGRCPDLSWGRYSEKAGPKLHNGRSVVIIECAPEDVEHPYVHSRSAIYHESGVEVWTTTTDAGRKGRRPR